MEPSALCPASLYPRAFAHAVFSSGSPSFCFSPGELLLLLFLLLRPLKQTLSSSQLMNAFLPRTVCSKSISVMKLEAPSGQGLGLFPSACCIQCLARGGSENFNTMLAEVLRECSSLAGKGGHCPGRWHLSGATGFFKHKQVPSRTVAQAE